MTQVIARLTFASNLDKWIIELENMGPLAPIADLVAMLNACPNLNHPEAVWLRDYVTRGGRYCWRSETA